MSIEVYTRIKGTIENMEKDAVATIRLKSGSYIYGSLPECISDYIVVDNEDGAHFIPLDSIEFISF